MTIKLSFQWPNDQRWWEKVWHASIIVKLKSSSTYHQVVRFVSSAICELERNSSKKTVENHPSEMVISIRFFPDRDGRRFPVSCWSLADSWAAKNGGCLAWLRQVLFHEPPAAGRWKTPLGGRGPARAQLAWHDPVTPHGLDAHWRNVNMKTWYLKWMGICKFLAGQLWLGIDGLIH